jgi:hypothetical protein
MIKQKQVFFLFFMKELNINEIQVLIFIQEQSLLVITLKKKKNKAAIYMY